ncbi:hypothetical protein D3C87_1274110 [compost metagenome]
MRFPSVRRPFSKRSDSGFAPANGAPSCVANVRNWPMALRVASAIAGRTLAVAHEPPETGAAGNEESPSLTSIFSNGRPVSSLTVCAAIV